MATCCTSLPRTLTRSSEWASFLPMYRFFLVVPGRVVVLGLEAADSCEEKCKSCDERAVKLRLEWNNNLRCRFEISEFWTISDWTELGLVELSLSIFVSCHKFCTVFTFAT